MSLLHNSEGSNKYKMVMRHLGISPVKLQRAKKNMRKKSGKASSERTATISKSSVTKDRKQLADPFPLVSQIFVKECVLNSFSYKQNLTGLLEDGGRQA